MERVLKSSPNSGPQRDITYDSQATRQFKAERIKENYCSKQSYCTRHMSADKFVKYFFFLKLTLGLKKYIYFWAIYHAEFNKDMSVLCEIIWVKK